MISPWSGHNRRSNSCPVCPSSPHATTERACTSSPTLVRFRSTGDSHICGSTARACSLPATHVHMWRGPSPAPIPSRLDAVVASSERNDPPGWWRAALLVPAGLVVGGVLLTAGRLPAVDPTVWLETALIAVSTVLLVAVACWLITRAAVPDRRIVLTWGLGSGTVLGLLWMSEIAFNNLAPHAVATPAARGVLDNLTWAIVGGVTMAAAARVTLRTGRLRCGIRTGAWSGLASGLGAAAGGALLLAFLRAFVQSDPLMIDE